MTLLIHCLPQIPDWLLSSLGICLSDYRLILLATTPGSPSSACVFVFLQLEDEDPLVNGYKTAFKAEDMRRSMIEKKPMNHITSVNCCKD